MPVGEVLRNARLQRKLTVAQVAAETRLKPHVIEELERDDFSQITAPVYGKGFIKLYAEYVGVDPRPLINDYMHHHARFIKPSLKGDGSTPEFRPVHMPLDKMKIVQQVLPEEMKVTDLSEPEPIKPAIMREAPKPVLPKIRVEPPQEAEESEPVEEAGPRRSIASKWSSIRTDSGPMKVKTLLFQYGPLILGIVLLILIGISIASRFTKKAAKDPVATQTVAPVKPAPEKVRVVVEPPDPYFKK